MVDRSTLMEELKRAMVLVAEGKERVDHQRKIVATLEQDGHDTTLAKTVLGTLEQTQQTYEDHLHLVQSEVDEA